MLDLSASLLHPFIKEGGREGRERERDRDRCDTQIYRSID